MDTWPMGIPGTWLDKSTSTMLGSGQYPYLCVFTKDVLSAPTLQQAQSGAGQAETS